MPKNQPQALEKFQLVAFSCLRFQIYIKRRKVSRGFRSIFFGANGWWCGAAGTVAVCVRGKLCLAGPDGLECVALSPLCTRGAVALASF